MDCISVHHYKSVPFLTAKTNTNNERDVDLIGLTLKLDGQVIPSSDIKFCNKCLNFDHLKHFSKFNMNNPSTDFSRNDPGDRNPTEVPSEQVENAEDYSFDRKLGVTYIVEQLETFPADLEAPAGKERMFPWARGLQEFADIFSQ